MNILITGANGFIGQALCKRLMAAGYQVRGAVRRADQMTALPSGVEGAMIGDIGPETDWSEALDGIEGIVHLAARVHVMCESAADPLAAFREVNVEGTKCLAIAAANASVKRFVYISSVKVNGERTRYSGQWSVVSGQEKTEIGRKRDERPTSNIERPTSNEKDEELATPVPSAGATGQADPHRLTQTFVRATCSDKNSHRFAKEKAEDSSDPYTEMDVPEPRDPYAVSKWEAEQILRDIAADTGLEVVVLRPPLVYGPGVKANFLRLLKLIHKGIPLPLGLVRNRRSMVYLGNLVSAIMTCLEHRRAAGETFLISDGEDVSTAELVQKMASAMGRKATLLPVPLVMLKALGLLTGKRAEIDRLTGSLCVDSSKIRELLDWQAPYTFEQGIQETVDWYQSADYAEKDVSRKGAKAQR